MHGLGLSPDCFSNTSQLTEEASILGGVPVFRRLSPSSNDCKLLARNLEVLSFFLPPSSSSSPVNKRPFRKVPAVKIIFLALIFFPLFRITPTAFCHCKSISITSSDKVDSKCSLFIIFFTDLL